MKTCNVCLQTKENKDFNRRKLLPRKDGSAGVSLKSMCKDCMTIDRACRKYKISRDEYLSLLEKQNNRCAVCFKKETTIDSRFGRIRALSVDHNHKTGLVRGLLCENCNRAIGLFKDNPSLLIGAANYLEDRP